MNSSDANTENNDVAAFIAKLAAVEENSAGVPGSDPAEWLGLLRQARELLARQTQDMEALVNSALDAMLVVDNDMCIHEVNPAACALFGMGRVEIIGKSALEFIGAGFDPSSIWANFIAQGKMEGLVPIQGVGGQMRICQFSATANFLPGKHFAILRDVTERIALEEELNERTRALDLRARQFDVLYRVSELLGRDRTGTESVCQAIVELLPAAMQFPEYAAAQIEIKGKNYFSKTWGAYTHAIEAPITAAEKIIGRVRVAYNAPPVDDDLFLPQEQTLLHTVAHRLSSFREYLSVEDSLRETRIRFDTAVSNLPIALFSIDREGYITFAAGPVIAAFGAYADALIGLYAPDVFALSAAQRERFAQVKAGQVLREQIQFRQRVFDVTITPLLDDARAFAGTTALATDITEQVLAEEAHARAERRYVDFLEAAPDAILGIDADQNIVLFTASAERVFGFTKQEVLGKSLDLLIPEPSVATHRGLVARFIKADIPGRNTPRMVAGRRRDGSTFPAETTFSKSQLGDSQVVNVIVRDITEKESANRKLAAHAREMELLYELTHDLAGEHDVKILLEKILARAQDLFHAERGLIALADLERQEIEVVTTHNTPFSVGERVSFGQGISGMAARRETMIVNHYPEWPHRLTHFSGKLPEAQLATPMLFQGELIGVVTLATDRAGHVFTDADAHLLELFAGQAAGVVHDARLREGMRERSQQLELLYKTGVALNREYDAQVQMRLLLHSAVSALRSERGAFWSFNAQTGRLMYEIAFGSPPHIQELAKGLQFDLNRDTGLAAVAARTREPLQVADVRTDARWIETEPEIRSAVWVPVMHQDNLLGVLSVASERVGNFTAMDVQTLVLYANQFSAVLENTRLLIESRRRVRQLQALHTIDNAISASFDLRVILEIYLDIVLSELGVDAADLLVFDAAHLQLQWAGGRGFRTRARMGQSVSLHDSAAGRVVLERRTLFVTKQSMDVQMSDLFKSGEDFATYVGVPLLSKGQLKGVMELYHRSLLVQTPEWSEFLAMLSRQAALAIDNALLFEALQKSNYELGLAYDETIQGWARALDLRGHVETGSAQTLTDLTMQLVRRLGVPETEWEHIRRGALLHDIGNMSIPDSLFAKTGPLTPEEWVLVKQHPQFAHDLMSSISYLRPAVTIPYCHHERWDGSGYPRGLEGLEIPLAARAFAIADVWLALTTAKPYRPAWTPAQANAYLEEQSGKSFDPQIVPVFLEMLRE